MADAQKMKDIYSSLMDAVMAGDTGTFESVLADDYAWYGGNGEELDRAGTIEMVSGYVTAFPDMQFTVHNMMAEGDMLSVMWSVSGTHTGPMGDVPATGKTMNMRGHVLCRFAGDQIVEEWELFDEALMMRQLGLAD